MVFDFTKWESIDDLVNKIKTTANVNTLSDNTEIERKWIVDYKLINFLIVNYEVKSHRKLLQGYLSVDPEIRYICDRDLLGNRDPIVKHTISHKSNGDLYREEYELEITVQSAINITKAIREDKNIKYCNKIHNSKLIEKDYWVFDVGDGKEIEITTVDNDKYFTYMEIEFKNIKDANQYELPNFMEKYIISEVTFDPKFKMKNYWKRTRLMENISNEEILRDIKNDCLHIVNRHRNDNI